jgi:hypothetical protein
MKPETQVSSARTQTHTLVLNKHVTKLVHGDSALGRFNTHIALFITKVVGSMWCAYVFALLALISLPAAISSHNPIIIVGWIAQTFLQLVLLPIIIVGQNIQAAASDARAQSDHETLNAIHVLSTEIYNINEQQSQILDLLKSKKER